MEYFKEILGGIIALLGLLFGWHKWSMHQADKKHDSHISKFKEIEDRFVRNGERIGKNEKMIMDTRDELYRDYPRNESVLVLKQELGEEINRVHQRLGGISREINQMVGAMEAHQNNQMTAMVGEIRNAIKEQGNAAQK